MNAIRFLGKFVVATTMLILVAQSALPAVASDEIRYLGKPHRDSRRGH